MDARARAYKGLADAYKGKGELERCKQYLQRAAEVYAQFDRLEETKRIFIEILKYESNVPNPFNTLGVQLRKQGDYPAALHAYKQALQLTPEDENVYFNIAKAQYYMGDLDEAAGSITRALELAPDFTEAMKLYRRIFGRAFVPTAPTQPRKPVPLDKPSSARDI